MPIVNYEKNKCWCGSENSTVLFDKQEWRCLPNTFFSLLKCDECDTVRTSFCEYRDYNLNVYSELSERHYNSLEIFKKYHIKGNVLEIGCSKGLFLKEIQKQCDDINYCKGIDNYADAILNKENLDIQNISLKELYNNKEKFDNIIMIHVLEHFLDLKKLFKDIKNISKVGTIIYFCVPNHESCKNLVYFGALDPREHYYHFTKQTLEKIIKHFFNCDIIHSGTSNIWTSGEQIDIVFQIKE